VTSALQQLAASFGPFAIGHPALDAVLETLGLPTLDVETDRSADAQILKPRPKKTKPETQPAPTPDGATPKADKQEPGTNGNGAPVNRVAKAFNPDQPRDEGGQWSSEGADRRTAASTATHHENMSAHFERVGDVHLSDAHGVAGQYFRRAASAKTKNLHDTLVWHGKNVERASRLQEAQ
jgi:hypothetical protein